MKVLFAVVSTTLALTILPLVRNLAQAVAAVILAGLVYCLFINIFEGELK